MLIVGAGLSGLLAGVLNPTARIIESKRDDEINHRALLRFREDKVSKATGIDFRRVKVRKAIWDGIRFSEPNMRLANMYSNKVIHKYLGRSIWDVEPVDRFVAPEDFIERLVEMNSRRIEWNTPFSKTEKERPIISTMAMPLLLVNMPIKKLETVKPTFQYEPIIVDQYRIANCDLHQTVYFPLSDTTIYRASITGSVMIVERVSAPNFPNIKADMSMLMTVFGLENEPEPIRVNHVQNFGKIAPIDDVTRKNLILHFSTEHRIYSLGRYATWRNILLDDVYDDLFVIRRLMTQGDYDHHRSML